MSDILIWLGNLALAVGVVMLIALVGVWWLLRRINGKLDAQIQELLKQAEDTLIGIEVEVEDNQYYFYNSKDKSFICQGSTAEQLKEAFLARFPDKNAFFVGGDPTAIEYLTGELKRLNHEST